MQCCALQFVWQYDVYCFVNHNVFVHEIAWPDEVEERHLMALNLDFLDYIRTIDNALVKLRKPWNNSNHVKLFNDHKKILHCWTQKNTVMVSCKGPFTHLNLGFSHSYHDVRFSTTLTSIGARVLTSLMTTVALRIFLQILSILERTCPLHGD